MTVDLRHLRVSGKPVEGDASLLQGPDWDAAHVLLQGPASLLGRSDAAAGQAATQEIALDPATMAFVAGKLAAIIPAAPTTLPPSGAAGGDLAGSYPSPTIKASVALTGAPTAPTAAPGTSTTQLATTAFVAAALDLYLTTAAAASTYAPLASPTFTGDPKAPTPATADNDTSIATTAFVKAQGYALASSIPTTLPPSGAATGDLTGTYPAPTIKADVGLTGNPTAATQLTADNSTRLATTAFVKAQSYITAAALATYAPLASPALTGTPTAPTALTADNSTTIATTAFVKAQGYLTTATAASTYAPIASPTFTGVPAGPTAAPGTNTTQLASTAFVAAAVAAAVGGSTPTGPAGGDLAGTYPNPTLLWISRVAGKTLAISNTLTLAGTDASTLNIGAGGTLGSAAFTASSAYLAATAAAGGDLAGNYPNPTIKASVSLTGVPLSTTPTAGDNSTKIATTAFVAASFLTTATAASTYAPIASPTFTGKATTAASATGGAGFNLPHGAAPTAPANGDLWTTSAGGLYVRINAATVGPLISAASIPAALPPNGAASGDLTGSYPSPTIKASVGLTGTPTAPTVATADSSTSIATTAFVKAQAYAPIASPTFTGKATTAASAAGGAGFNLPHGAAPTAPVNGDLWTTSAGGLYARINAATVGPFISAASIPAALPPNGAASGDLAGTYPSPTIKASVALTGTPTVPTAAYGTGTTQAASCAFVAGSGPSSATAAHSTDLLLNNTSAFISSTTAVIGPLGASGEKWRIQAGGTFSNTGGTGDYITMQIWNGAATVIQDTVLTSQGGNCHITLAAQVTLTGATTFTVQAKDSSSVNGHMVGGYITAQRVS